MATAVSFFAGAGGLDTGLIQAGFDLKLVVELEKVFCQTLKINHRNLNVREGNIMDYDKKKVYYEAGLDLGSEIDLMAGGSPCQSFSTAGNRLAFDDPRGKAMLKFAQLVSEVKPKVFLLENVKGLLSAALKHRPLHLRGDNNPPLEPEEQPGSALSFLLKQFKGYKIKHHLINAADFGVPQTRERVFFVGVRNDLKEEFTFPIKTHSSNQADGLLPWVTFEKLFKDINIKKHHHPDYSPERLQYMKLVPHGGGNWRDLPKEVVQSAMGGAYQSGGGKVGFYRRISVKKPSPTLLTSPIQKSTNLGHPFEDRPLSIEEYLIIQEFPDDYLVKGTLAQQYIQIGNAVPVRLARVLGEAILELLQALDNKYTRKKYTGKVAVTAINK